MIHSMGWLEGNTSIAEVYYNDMGYALIGLGIFAFCLLVGIADKN
jgi:hypothetical protein